MPSFKVEFSTKKGEFKREFTIEVPDEAISWQWTEKQKEIWEKSGSSKIPDVKKLRVKLTDLSKTKPAPVLNPMTGCPVV